MEPLFHVVERFLIGHVVNNDDAVSAAIVTAGDRSETFLTGRVPLKRRRSRRERSNSCVRSFYNLQFDCFPVEIDRSNFLKTKSVRDGNSSTRSTYKVHADCADITFCVGVILNVREKAVDLFLCRRVESTHSET